MKALILFLCLILFSEAGFAQKKQTNSSRKNQNQLKAKTTGPETNNTQTVTLFNRSNHAALAPTPASPLRIADPTIIALNERTTFPSLNLDGNSIIGMPKRYYGIANGRLFLRTTDATSSGSITGNGSVGTGTSIGTTGTAGNSIGINGKSPLAGPAIYGTPGPKPVQSNQERKQ